jgi:hypothetical protein
MGVKHYLVIQAFHPLMKLLAIRLSPQAGKSLVIPNPFPLCPAGTVSRGTRERGLNAMPNWLMNNLDSMKLAVFIG